MTTVEIKIALTSITVSLILPYLLRLPPGKYPLGAESGFLTLKEQFVSGAEGSGAKYTLVSITFEANALVPPEQQFEIKRKQADRLLGAANRLIRWYRSETRQAGVLELTRAQASPFSFHLTATGAAWEEPLAYESDALPSAIPGSMATIAKAVRKGLASDADPEVADLFLLDAEQALRDGRFREAVLFCWSTIDATFSSKYDQLVDEVLAGEWSGGRDWLKDNKFGMKNKMSAMLYLISGRSLFREPDGFWANLSASYKKRNDIIHNGHVAQEADAQTRIERGAIHSAYYGDTQTPQNETIEKRCFMSHEATERDLGADVRWNLGDLFAGMDDPRINEILDASQARAEKLEADYKGRINAPDLTAKTLAEAVREYEALQQESYKPISYASLLFTTDTGDPARGAFLQKMRERGTQFTLPLLFLELELAAVSDEVLLPLLDAPEVAPYKHYIGTVRATRAHVLSETEERLMEELANTGGRAFDRLFDEITSTATFEWNGEELSQAEILDKVMSPDRETRRTASAAFTEGLQKHSRTLTFIFNTLMQDKNVKDRLRKFATPQNRGIWRTNWMKKPSAWSWTLLSAIIPWSPATITSSARFWAWTR